MEKKKVKAENNSAILKGSFFARSGSAACVFLESLAGKCLRFFAAWLRNVSTARRLGLTVIVAVLFNLFMINITASSTEPAWLLYRCLIALLFLPWLFIDMDLQDAAGYSKVLNLFRGKK